MNLILFGSFIIGIILILYGSVTLPSEIPGYNGTYTDSSQSSSQQLQQHQTDVMNYQIHSNQFIILIVGICIIFLDLLYICYYNFYSEEKETKKRSIIKIPSNKKIIPIEKIPINTKPINTKQINKVNNTSNKNIEETNTIEKRNIHVEPPKKISIILNNREVKVKLPNDNSKNINFPTSHKLQDYSKLYFHQLPSNYQKYFIENNKKCNNGIDYQYIK